MAGHQKGHKRQAIIWTNAESVQRGGVGGLSKPSDAYVSVR